MKDKKIIMILVAAIVLVVLGGVLIWLLLRNNVVSDTGPAGNDQTVTSDADSQDLIEVPVVDLPNLTIENNSDTITDEDLREGFENYYKYYYYFLGAPNDFERGLTWVWDDSLLSWSDYTDRGIDNFVSATNSIYLGPLSYDDSDTEERERERLFYGYMHETAHLFFQYNHEPISYDFGQWIWEGEALLAETMTRRALGDIANNETGYDVQALLGTMINGVTQDGNKFNRSIVDSNATMALPLMTDILSDSGTYDFPSKVNALKVAKAEDKGNKQLSREEYSEILDEAADGKTIDGVSPSKWLFDQPVSNVDGPLGTYFGITPGRAVDKGIGELRIVLYGFERTSASNGRETYSHEIGFENVPVITSLYDASGNLIKSMETNINSDGVEETGFGQLEGVELYTGVYKMTAEAVYKGETLTATSFSVNLGNDVPLSNDNMFFILLNEDGTEVRTDVGDEITVEGAESVNTDYMANGLLIVTLERGSSVTINYGDTTAVYSKPFSARVIPIRAM